MPLKILVRPLAKQGLDPIAGYTKETLARRKIFPAAPINKTSARLGAPAEGNWSEKSSLLYHM
jgi:hypothetical protein